jgi:3-dehydroquinate synthase
LFFLVDKEVSEIYWSKIEWILSSDRVVLIEPREISKTLDYCGKVIEQLVEKNIRRNETLIIIGGGTTQDVGGFIANILYRGIDWEFYPTTLLAQADSCVGSKTSLNLGEYKNLLGTFYPPSAVVIDVGFLETLPVDEIKSGIGEMLHFYLVDGSEMADDLIEKYDEIVEDRKRLRDYIRHSLEIKKRMVEIDEFDKRERKLFNYGHSFGHAIESVSGYKVKHGQAVTMGMDIANFVSYRFGLLELRTFKRIRQLLLRNMPDFRLGYDQLDKYFAALWRDKKNMGGNLGCVLTRGPGYMEHVQVPIDDKLRKAIADYFFGRDTVYPRNRTDK